MFNAHLSLAWFVVPAAFVAGCIMVPPPQSGGDPASAGGAPPVTTPEAPTPAPGAAGSGSEPTKPQTSKGPTPSSIEVKNTCSKTVQLFIGEKPKFGSGTKTSISSNTTTTYPRKPDGTAVIWIIDDKENGIKSAQVGADTKRVEIGSSCSDISAH